MHLAHRRRAARRPTRVRVLVLGLVLVLVLVLVQGMEWLCRCLVHTSRHCRRLECTRRRYRLTERHQPTQHPWRCLQGTGAVHPPIHAHARTHTHTHTHTRARVPMRPRAALPCCHAAFDRADSPCTVPVVFTAMASKWQRMCLRTS